MSKIISNKLASSFLALLAVSFLQLNWKAALGWSPELAMSLLVVAGFYLGVIETAALSAFGVLLFNWKPLPGWEVLFFFSLPFFAMIALRILPWRNWLNGVLAAVVSVAVFYAVSVPGAVLENLPLFAAIIAATAVFSAVFFHIFDYFYKISPI